MARSWCRPARFLADPEALLSRAGKVGVIWPNNRDLDDLVRISIGWPRSRWCSRPSATAAPTARRALLRERHGYDGELRATGQVLRDQFVFMTRAGFDAFEVKKDADADAFAETMKRYSVFYQPTGDGRVTALNRRMQLRHSESAGQ